MNKKAEQILKNSNPIDSMVDYMIHFIEAKGIDKAKNTPEQLRERIVDGMFQYSMGRLSPETQVAMLNYVAKDPTSQRKEQFLIGLGSGLAVLIRHVAHNNDNYILDMSKKTDTFPIYTLITSFANDYESAINMM
jgi:hypothetical protein